MQGFFCSTLQAYVSNQSMFFKKSVDNQFQLAQLNKIDANDLRFDENRSLVKEVSANARPFG